MKLITKILLMIFTLSFLPACSTKDKGQTFQSTLRKYERVMRWGDVEKLNQFRKKPLVFSSVLKERYKNIKVTGYNEISIEAVSKLSYIVSVNIKYYHQQYLSEREIEDRQEWNFDETREQWYISSPLPKF